MIVLQQNSSGVSDMQPVRDAPAHSNNVRKRANGLPTRSERSERSVREAAGPMLGSTYGVRSKYTKDPCGTTGVIGSEERSRLVGRRPNETTANKLPWGLTHVDYATVC